MKKGLVALVVVAAGAIGVLGYFAYPQIKIALQERSTSNEQEKSETKNQDWQVDVGIAETEAEKTFISMYNEYAPQLPKLFEKMAKGEKLSFDDEWMIEAIGQRIGQFYEQNEYSIRPSIAFSVMDKIAELMGAEKPSVAWEERDQRRLQRTQEFNHRQDSIEALILEKIAREERTAEIEAQPQSSNREVARSRADTRAPFPGSSPMQNTQPAANQGQIQCSVCKEWYDENDLEVAGPIHWRHEEEALVREFFGEAGIRKYREQGRWNWDFDIEWLESMGMAETEWLSVSEIRNSWIAYQKWKRENGRNEAEAQPVGQTSTSYNLAGRSGRISAPRYDGSGSGRVVVEITVDAAGNVTKAAYRAQGSTTNDNTLINTALDAAKKARFNTDPSASTTTGTITYNFTLK